MFLGFLQFYLFYSDFFAFALSHFILLLFLRYLGFVCFFFPKGDPKEVHVDREWVGKTWEY